MKTIAQQDTLKRTQKNKIRIGKFANLFRFRYEIKSSFEVNSNTCYVVESSLFIFLVLIVLIDFECNILWIFRDKIGCDQNSLEMDFDNPKIPRGPFEHSEGHHRGGTKDSNDLSFRVPSVPNSPSPALTSSQQDSSRQRSNEINGSNSHGKIFKFLSTTYIIHTFQIS